MHLFGLLLLSLGVSRIVANDSSCGKDPSKVKDCENVDLGSCGNACCAIDCVVNNATPLDVRDAIEDFLKSGGTDGSFTFSDKSDAAGHDPSDDLRPYNLTQQFIFQGTHATTGGYIDTLDFAVSKTDDAYTTVVRAFSISNIHGALGDGGQNYKTLKFLSDGIESQTGSGCDEIKIVHGCGGGKLN